MPERRHVLIAIVVLLAAAAGPARTQPMIRIDGERDAVYDAVMAETGPILLTPADAIPRSGPAPASPADLSARIWTAWDSTFFYLFADIRDDTVRVSNPERYQNDCLEIKFDPDPGRTPLRGVISARLTALDSVGSEVAAGVDNLYPEGFWPIPLSLPDRPSRYARKRTATGYQLELRIPWAALDIDGHTVSAVPGTRIGIAFTVHDNDTGGRDHSLQWSAGMADEIWNTPQLLGTAELLAGNRLGLSRRNAIDPAARPGRTYLSTARMEWVRDIVGPSLFLENWRYRSGDDPAWADPRMDDRDWITATTLLPAANLPGGDWPGVGWFRIHLVVDSSMVGYPLGLSVWQSGRSRLYLDGDSIWTIEAGSGEQTGLPKAVVFTRPGAHLLALRHATTDMNRFHAAGYYGGPIVRIGDLGTMVDIDFRREGNLTAYQMFFTSLPLAIGLLHLILFAFFPALRQHLLFALFLISYAVTIFVDYQASLSTDVAQHLFFLRIHRGVNILWVTLQLAFVYSLFYDRLPRQFWGIALAAIAMGVGAIIKPLENNGLFGLVAIVVTVEVFRVVVTALVARREGAWIIALAILWFYCFGIFDTLMDAGFAVPFREMENPYAFGTIGFFLAMSVYLSRDFARTNRRVAEQEIERKLLEAENARQAAELEAARQFQLSMLPTALPDRPHLDIAVYTRPATEVGGDYYDFHDGDDGSLTLAIGDATGHGMKAGTMVAASKSLFNALAREPSPVAILRKATRALKSMNLERMYMAMTIARLEGSRMRVSAAGMPFPLIYHAASGRLEELPLKGLPLGGLDDFPYGEMTVDLEAGDAVLFRSDGFEEMFNVSGDMLGEERTRAFFQAAADGPAETIIARLLAAGERFAGGRPAHDDVTFVVLRVRHGGPTG